MEKVQWNSIDKKQNGLKPCLAYCILFVSFIQNVQECIF